MKRTEERIKRVVARFNELIIGRRSTEAYELVAEEFTLKGEKLSASTVAQMVGKSGNYCTTTQDKNSSNFPLR